MLSGSQVEVIEKRRSVPVLDGIPMEFHTILTAMLQPDPASRPATMADVRDWQDSSPAKKSAKPGKTAKQTAQLEKARVAAKPLPESGPSHAIRNAAIVAGAFAVIGIGALGGWIFVKNPQGTKQQTAVVQAPEQKSTETPAQQSASPAQKSDEPAPVPTPLVQAQPAQPTVATPPTPAESSQPEPIVQPGQTPSQPTQAELPKVDQASGLRSFVTSFGAGKCFFAKIRDITAKSADITVFSTKDVGTSFHDAFQAKAGYAPNIGLSIVAKEQCPFVEVLGKMPTGVDQILDMALDKSSIRARDEKAGVIGDNLKLRIKDAGKRNVYVFLVDQMGGVTNINRSCRNCIKMTDNQLLASVPLYAPEPEAGVSLVDSYPLLVFAVASAKPLIALNNQDAYEPDEFTQRLLTETASDKDFSTAIQFAKLVTK
jgi:hypothetical protein